MKIVLSEKELSKHIKETGIIFSICYFLAFIIFGLGAIAYSNYEYTEAFILLCLGNLFGFLGLYLFIANRYYANKITLLNLNKYRRIKKRLDKYNGVVNK